MSTYRKIGEEARIQHCQYIGLDTPLPPPFFLRILYLVLAVRKNPGERVKKQTLRWQNFRTELGAQ